jgi:hypothetical protein
MVPNYNRKVISGRSNDPCMVTSHKMNESEMGYRGSKSEIITPQPNNISVKEQRVDGSWLLAYKAISLRCTLTGFERHYPVKIPSKQLNNRSFSTLNLNPVINPWFLTGFADAEGCFTIKIQQNVKLKTKWRVRPVFSITLNSKDLFLLEAIQQYLGVGKIRKCGGKAIIYAVDSIKEIPVIIKHFDEYSLITHKLSDYLIFKECFEIIKQGEHLNDRGLLDIIGLKTYLNLGLSEKLKQNFPNVVPVERPDYKFKVIPDPSWVAGFTSGDGSFHIVFRNAISKSGVFARFSIHLHKRELDVLRGIATYFKLFNENFYVVRSAALENKPMETFPEKKIIIGVNSVNLQISKFYDIANIIIPFFNKYPILGIKSLDFLDFKKVCDIIKTKEHLSSPSVYNQILKIKSCMNLNRKM